MYAEVGRPPAQKKKKLRQATHSTRSCLVYHTVTVGLVYLTDKSQNGRGREGEREGYDIQHGSPAKNSSPGHPEVCMPIEVTGQDDMFRRQREKLFALTRHDCVGETPRGGWRW